MYSLLKAKHKYSIKWKIHVTWNYFAIKKRNLINAVLKTNIKQILIAILKSTSNIWTTNSDTITMEYNFQKICIIGGKNICLIKNKIVQTGMIHIWMIPFLFLFLIFRCDQKSSAWEVIRISKHHAFNHLSFEYLW